MLYKLAIHYISHCLKKSHISGLEVIIRDDDWTYNRRDKDKEKSIKNTLDLIK